MRGCGTLSPAVTFKFTPHLEWGWRSWFGGASLTALKPVALCLKPQNLESDPKYTLDVPPHWAEVMKTKGRAALPHLLGVTSSGDSAASPLLKCQVSTGQEGTHKTDQSLLQPKQMLHPAMAGTF